MTQPLNRGAKCEALGQLDTEAGEFWMENPWLVGDHNVSAYERNRILLNSGQRSFIDISHLCGSDIDSDSRSVVTGDINQDGMPDVIVRSSGGGPLRVFLNRFPQRNWLKLSLRGERSNRQGIGAKLKFKMAGLTIYRELYPVASFYSQEACMIHIGLGDAAQVDQLTVAWPSGITQEFENVESNQSIVIDESDSTIGRLSNEPR